ncbi:MAG TPA: FHA domain-containing protein [Candidatus Acidoferrum sp.]|nr:FHA domain-containing protein [Candidatus Acidoferrum sp.]
MDELIAILEKFKVLLTTVVTVILLAIIFRRPIAELIANVASIEIDPAKRRWKVQFGQRVRQERQRAATIPREVAARSPEPAAPPPSKGATQSGRDIVLAAWGAVRQAVYDGCIANKAMTPTLGVREALQRLNDVRTLAPDLVQLVRAVYDVGQEVADDRGLRPEDDDARAYASLVNTTVYWLGLSALPPLPPLPPQQPTTIDPPKRRATVVGGHFVQPTPGSPSAALVAIAGPMKGQQYVVDKPTYRLGRNANNDLCAAADDSISGEHACLRYQNGGLFLYDQASRNGTFLNEQRVTGTPVMVGHGDRIRLGESVFEVGTPSAPQSGGTKDDGIKGPGRSVIF